MRLLDRFTRAHYASMEDFLENYRVHIPEGFNFATDVIDEYARVAPHQRAMIWVNEAGEERVFTFSDMKRYSDRYAEALAKKGLKKGDAVLLLMKRRYEYWFVSLALMKLRCIQIPAVSQLQVKDVVYRLNAASVSAVICVGEEGVASIVREAAESCPSVRTMLCVEKSVCGMENLSELAERASGEIPKVQGDNDEIMLMYFTSGTTGMPKMVAHDYRYPLGHLITGAFWHNLNEESVHLTVADTGWAKCGWGKMFGQWIAGTTLFVYDFERFSAPRMLEILAKYRVTSFCAPPTIYRYMIKEDMSRYDLSALKWGTVAGEPLNPEVYRQFYDATGVKLREGFGQSETTPLLLTPLWLEPRVGSVGVPSPHYHIRLIDGDGRDVEAGEEGEICVDVSNGHPAGLLTGYYRDPEASEKAFAGGVYHTGDMAWRDEDGYYWFIGRADDVIKSSGYRIGPFEVESALVAHPTVVECAITALPDPDRGQIVKATIVLAKGYEPSDALKKELQDHVKAVTAPYKYPRVIEFVKELPKTVSGKIRRKDIRMADNQ
ncbi:MAG: AMP-binding protein [Christensenellales bacterium]|jgi:acetyl-CoA synthetase